MMVDRLGKIRAVVVIIRKMSCADLDATVAIHEKAFGDFFLTRMGPKFLHAYYRAVLDFEASIALVAQNAQTGHILGFAVGFRNPKSFYALLRQRRKRMVLAILLAVLRDPRLIPHILRNVRRVEAQSRQTVDAVELSSVAVSTSGIGLGGSLLEAFTDRAHSDGAHSVFLTTDAEKNDHVRSFYESRGFTLDGFETRGTRKLCRYVRALG